MNRWQFQTDNASYPQAHADRAAREARVAFLLVLPGLVIAMILTGLWTILVNTASLGGDESTLVQGSGGVVRNLPAYLLFVGVGVVSLVYATLATRHGFARGMSRMALSAIGVLFALDSVTRDSAEVVMTTRAATTTWILRGVDVVVVAIAFVVAHRWARRHA
jgi:hypothetical protein